MDESRGGRLSHGWAEECEESEEVIIATKLLKGLLDDIFEKIEQNRKEWGC